MLVVTCTAFKSLGGAAHYTSASLCRGSESTTIWLSSCHHPLPLPSLCDVTTSHDVYRGWDCYWLRLEGEACHWSKRACPWCYVTYPRDLLKGSWGITCDCPLETNHSSLEGGLWMHRTGERNYVDSGNNNNYYYYLWIRKANQEKDIPKGRHSVIIFSYFNIFPYQWFLFYFICYGYKFN